MRFNVKTKFMAGEGGIVYVGPDDVPIVCFRFSETFAGLYVDASYAERVPPEMAALCNQTCNDVLALPDLGQSLLVFRSDGKLGPKVSVAEAKRLLLLEAVPDA